jgi:hypothetical protein
MERVSHLPFGYALITLDAMAFARKLLAIPSTISRTIVSGVTAYDIDATKVSMSAGTHMIHFTSWTSNGIWPVVDTRFSTVTQNPKTEPV